MNKNSILLLFFFILTGLYSCEEGEIDNKEIPVTSELKEFDFSKKTSYDLTMDKLAKGVSEALRNDEFRSIIRNSVEKGFTNDFDVPIAYFTEEHKLKSAAGLDVALFLEGIIYPERASKLKSTENVELFLDSLVKAYPDLMFSIPVNVEMIDEGVQPYVLYIPEAFQDVTYKSIQAINPRGEIELLSLEDEPNVPVLVIKRREGGLDVESNDDLSNYKSATATVNDDIELRVFTHDAGVKISWTKKSNILKYSLFRYNHIIQKGVDSESFEQVVVMTNNNPDFYIDEKTYSSMPKNVYYERYRMDVTYSDNTVVSYYAHPNEELANVKIGDVSSLGNKIIQVNWTQPNGGTYVGYNVYRASSVSSEGNSPNNVWDNGWLLCNSQILSPHLTSWTDYDSQKIPGKAYFYRVLPRTYSDEQNWDFQASSNIEAAKYINVAICSDRSDNAQLISTHIKTSDISDLEGWIYGKPEFKFAVFGYNSLDASFNPENAKRLGEFSINKEHRRKDYNSGVAINKTMLLNWSNDLNFEIIAVVGYEHDDDIGGWDAIALKLKTLAIDLIQKTVQTKTGVDISSLTDVLKSQRGDTYAGGAYIIRSGKENVTLKLDQGSGGKDQKQLPAGGVKLRISSSTNTNAWQKSWDNDIVQLGDDRY